MKKINRAGRIATAAIGFLMASTALRSGSLSVRRAMRMAVITTSSNAAANAAPAHLLLRPFCNGIRKLRLSSPMVGA